MCAGTEADERRQQRWPPCVPSRGARECHSPGDSSLPMELMLRSVFLGTGFAVPDQVITNDDLAARMDTSDEWIRTRTGIQERRWVRERSEEHTSELQSLMRISYAVFCLKKKTLQQ